MLCPGCANESFQTVHELSAHVRLFHFDFFKKSFRCKQQNCCNGSVCYSWAGFVRHIKRYAARELPVVNFEEGEVHEEIQDVEDVIVDNEFVDFDEDVDVQDEDRYSIEYFVNNFFKNTEFFAASLYAHPNSSRKLVHSVVQSTSDILTSTITILKQNVFKVLSNCTGDENFPHECAKLNSMFNVLESPFDGMSDFKRLCNLGETGKFIKPEPVLVCHEDKYVNREKTVELIRAPVYEYFIPLRKVLVKFLELPGMFSSITRFMSKLRNRSGISHFLQGGLWQQLSSKDDGKLFLPIDLHYDDYDPDNALGSHHGVHSFGALYASLAPDVQSSIRNMFLFLLYESKYRKRENGNSVVFAPVVSEMKFLESEGITINIDGITRQVYFRMCVIRADNAGCHSIEGFVEWFTARFYCKFCKMFRDDCKRFCFSVPNNLLRTVENYRDDVNTNNVSLTGIKELCVWNEIPSYHCVSNANCDIMHDLFEGVLKYDICKILHSLIHDRGYFSVSNLCERVNGFNYGPLEQGNKPPTCHFSVDRFLNCSLNLSSSEMLCFTRYLGEMVGDLIPEGNSAWKLYLVLHDILELIMCPVIEPGMDIYMRTLISEHHQTYVNLYGSLKPKHHFMLHYPDLLKRNGPLSSLSALTSERTHRVGKMYAKACNSRIDFPYSVSVKYQLSLCNRLMKYDTVSEKLVKSKFCKLQSLSNFQSFYEFFDVNPMYEVNVANGVYIFETMYKVDYGSHAGPNRKTSCHQALEVAALLAFYALFATHLLDIFMFYYLARKTSVWFALGVTVAWLYVDRHSPSRGGRRPWLRKPLLPLFRCLQGYYPVDIVRAEGAQLLPTKNYIMDVHPHGFTTSAVCATLCGGGMQSAFPSFDFKAVVLDFAFFVLPLAREVAMGLGCISMTECSIRHVLRSTERGKTVVIWSGDFREVFYMRRDAFYVRLKRRGFCRMALLEGTPLVPALMLGENLSYRQPLAHVSDFIYRMTGWRIPLFVGRGPGPFYHRWGFLPLRVPHAFVVGAPIEVRKTIDPTVEEIEALHSQYAEAVRKLYEECSPRYSSANLPLVIVT